MAIFGGNAAADWTYFVNTFTGTSNNDYFYIDNYLDKVIEAANGGNDTIVATADYLYSLKPYVLPRYVETLDIGAYNIEAFLQYVVDLDQGFTETDKNNTLASLSKKKAIIQGNASDNVFYSNEVSAQYFKLLGMGGNDYFSGTDGADCFDAGTGNDTIYCSTGDTIYGGAGDDQITIESTAAFIDGGAGNDSYQVFETIQLADVFKDAGGIDTIVTDGTINSLAGFKFIENLDASTLFDAAIDLDGNASNNTIKGTIVSNIINGFVGNDYIDGLGGGDDLIGGSGNDTYVLYDENAWIVEDQSVKTGGVDTIKISSGGDDMLYGATGNDTLTGGDGIDQFVFSIGENKDLITDMQDNEKIHINYTGGVDKDDCLFYSDTQGNLYLDYTNDGVGSDVIKMSNMANLNDSTAFIETQGLDTISLGVINQYLASAAGASYYHLTADQISNLGNYAASQYADLISASAWSIAPPGHI